MGNDYISEGEAIGWEFGDFDFQDEDAPLTENQKMLRFHGYDSEDDLSYISKNEWSRMWWSYRNREKLGLNSTGEAVSEHKEVE